MNILDKIVADIRRDLILKKSVRPAREFEKSILFDRKTVSLSERIRDTKIGIIAEHKRRSPSKPLINNSFSVEEVVKGYEQAGASGISVLTNGTYFGGSLDDLLLARASVQVPLLRKDFMVDEYQVLEAKACGADVILLIAAVLNPLEIKTLAQLAQSLQMEVLLEVHNREELEKSLHPALNLVGVNNRNLKTFEVNLAYSKDLSSLIPDEFVKVSESGISSVESILELSEHGFQGFLIGENFMKTDDPGNSAAHFINRLTL